MSEVQKKLVRWKDIPGPHTLEQQWQRFQVPIYNLDCLYPKILLLPPNHFFASSSSQHNVHHNFSAFTPHPSPPPLHSLPPSWSLTPSCLIHLPVAFLTTFLLLPCPHTPTPYPPQSSIPHPRPRTHLTFMADFTTKLATLTPPTSSCGAAPYMTSPLCAWPCVCVILTRQTDLKRHNLMLPTLCLPE